MKKTDFKKVFEKGFIKVLLPVLICAVITQIITIAILIVFCDLIPSELSSAAAVIDAVISRISNIGRVKSSFAVALAFSAVVPWYFLLKKSTKKDT